MPINLLPATKSHASRLAPTTGRSILWPWLAAVAVIAVVLLVYWPVTRAGFVWDDFLTFEQRAWLYYGDAWKRYIFTGFNEWTHYFRPLVVALFVLQVRLFEGAPEPMHMVSLGMHLANVLLVFAFARSLVPQDWKWRDPLALLGSVLYGLHPMLVESVTWIGCQFDQVQVMAALAGLLCSRHIDSIWPRAALVTACFFVSATAKESAASYPAIVLLFDWLLRGDRNLRPALRLVQLLRRNWPVYTGLLLAGLAYLWLRRAMMGATVAGLEPWMLVPNVARIDGIAYVYLKYWAVVVGIPTELNPLHPVGSVAFGENGKLLALRVLASTAVFSLGLLALTRRFTALGVLVLATTLYLLPVLGLLPVQFDNSIYHERYAIGAIVLACVLLPRVAHELRSLATHMPMLSKLAPLLALAWLAAAIPNIRATIPLWSNNVALWEWTLRANPGNELALGNLISAYIMVGESGKARALVNQTIADGIACDNCDINGFMLSVREGDQPMIDATVDRLRNSPTLFGNSGMRFNYFRTIGHLELRSGNLQAAVAALHEAIAIEAQEPFARLLLTEALVGLGLTLKAEREAALAVNLSHPQEREHYRQRSQRILGGEALLGLPILTPEGGQSATK